VLSLPTFLQYLGYALLTLLLIQYVRGGHWLRFPFFSGYLFPMAFRAFSLIWAGLNLSSEAYMHFYWITSNIVSVLRLLVIWEVLCWAVLQRPTLHRGLRLVSLLYFCVMAGLCLGMKAEGAYYVDIERKLSLVAVLWAAIILLAMLAFSIRPSRPIWAMVVGLGIYVAVYLMNQASFDLFRGFAIWRLIRQFDFSIMIGIWLWGFWKPAAPEPATQNGDADLTEWNKKWGTAKSEVVNLTHPS